MQIRSCVTLADMFISKLKHRFNSFVFFYRIQNGFEYKKDSQLLLKNFPARAKQMPSKVLLVDKKTRQPFGHLLAEIVIVGISK